jgi:cysteinyl-tRNA synthetase
MVLRIHNTKSGRDEVFEPHKEGRVAMYVCGPTTYDYSHVGHARSYVFYDIVRRYLGFLGLRVTYVQNFTDIDEKITKRAEALGEEAFDLSNRFIQAFLEDMDALGVMRADHNPRTSENIQDVVAMARRLLEKGAAYEVGGTVYFDATKRAGFGSLLHESLSDVTVDNGGAAVSEGRRGPLDFIVWKRGDEWGVSWDSPWGKGRPGWHSECSVMSRRFLGDVIDIHGGGLDLIYPHHESEAALSFALTGKEPVRFYMHNGFVVQDEVKMSKSKGNFTTVRALLKDHDGDGDLIRYFLLTKHYRKTLAFSKMAMSIAEERLDVIKEAATWTKGRVDGTLKSEDGHGDKEKGRRTTVAGRSERGGDCPEKYFEFERLFFEAMDDDFDTATALTVVHDMANCVLANRPSKTNAENALRVFGMVETILGIQLQS